MSNFSPQQQRSRPKVTYGRRVQDDLDSEMLDDSAISSQTTGTDHTEEQFRFPWQKALQALNSDMDEDEDRSVDIKAGDFNALQSKLKDNNNDAGTLLDDSETTQTTHRYSDELDISFDIERTRDTPPTSPLPIGDKSTNDEELAEDLIPRKVKVKSTKQKDSKRKGPTKQELAETARETARIRNGKRTTVRKEQNLLMFPEFFHRLSEWEGPISSDPIIPFESGSSSSPLQDPRKSSPSQLPSTPLSNTQTLTAESSMSMVNVQPPATTGRRYLQPKDPRTKMDSESDDELPEASAILVRHRAKLASQAKATSLLEKKQELIAKKQETKGSSSDELEIEENGRLGRNKNTFLDALSRPQQRSMRSLVSRQHKGMLRTTTRQTDIQSELLERSRLQAKEIERTRRQEWVSHGGSLPAQNKQQGKQMWEDLISKGMALTATDKDGYDSEADYKPSNDAVMEELGDYGDSQGSSSEMSNSRGTDKENIAPVPRLPSPLSNHPQDATEPNDENVWPASTRRSFASLIPLESSDDDHEAGSRKYPPLRGSRAKPKGIIYSSDDEADVLRSITTPHIRPLSISAETFGNILVPDTSFACAPPVSDSAGGATPMRAREDRLPPEENLHPKASTPESPQSYPVGNEPATGPSFMNFDDVGFSQLFANEKTVWIANQLSTHQGAMGLTQDETRLLPPVEMTTQQIEEEEEIFREDQEQKRKEFDAPRPQEVYLDAQGFLTQTKPPDLTPRLFPSTQGISGMIIGSPFTTFPEPPRPPLADISHSIFEELDEHEVVVQKRLHKKSVDDSPHARKMSLSHNAFERMMLASREEPKQDKVPMRKDDMRNFIVDEADESDEEALMGFGTPHNRDVNEGSSDEQQDGVVEGLLDDENMDADVENIDKVLEKHKEHEAADDANLQKKVEDIVEGRQRGKRRDRGVGVSDSDDSDDDSDEDRRRKVYSKKRKVKIDSLDALGRNPETQAFHRQYHRAIEDDGDEFSHLNMEQAPPLRALEIQTENVDLESLESDASSNSNFIEGGSWPQSAHSKTLSSANTLGIDSDYLLINDFDKASVFSAASYREIVTAPKGRSKRQQREGDSLLLNVKRSTLCENVKGKSWARDEGSSRGLGTGRAVAVIGSSARKPIPSHPRLPANKTDQSVKVDATIKAHPKWLYKTDAFD